MAPASEAGYGTAYHFRGHGWVRDPAKAGFTNAPWSPRDRRDMDDFVHNRRDALGGMGDAESWLDSITSYDLLDKLGYGPQVKRYIDPYIAVEHFAECGRSAARGVGQACGRTGR